MSGCVKELVGEAYQTQCRCSPCSTIQGLLQGGERSLPRHLLPAPLLHPMLLKHTLQGLSLACVLLLPPPTWLSVTLPSSSSCSSRLNTSTCAFSTSSNSTTQ